MKIIILGGGIVGLAIARELSLRGYIDITVIEKEAECASHQSSRNSGVMHAGLYYKPNSKKALLSRKGIKLLKEYKQSLISSAVTGKIQITEDLFRVPNKQ